jgi:hypothetical protein
MYLPYTESLQIHRTAPINCTQETGIYFAKFKVTSLKAIIVEDRVRLVDTGTKIRIKNLVRSQKTGMVLPKEGTLVRVSENLGRRLFLVAFADGNSEYLFAHEVE